MYTEDVYMMLLTQYLGKNPNANEKDFLEFEIERSTENKSRIRYFQIKLDRLPKEGSRIRTRKKPLPYQIALLNELGFFELDKFQNLPKSKVYEITATLLNTDSRTVKGNHAVLDPNSNENRSKFTSQGYMEEVKKYINNI